MLRAVTWVKAWAGQLRAAQLAYTDPDLIRHAPTAVTALAHLGALLEATLPVIALARLPGSALDGQVPMPPDVITRQAIDVATQCLKMARDVNLAGDDVATCARLLEKRDPLGFPALREVLPAPSGPPWIADSELPP